MKKSRLKKFIGAVLAAVSISFGIIGCSGNSIGMTDSLEHDINEVDDIKDAPFEITFMNVGKADCIIIKIGDKSLMIDTGLNSTKKDVIAELNEQGIDTLDYLILTHMDKDHIGGADAVIDNLKINNVIQADYSKDSKQYNQYITALDKNNIEPVLIHETISMDINDAQINIYPALKDTYSQSNDYSIIVAITYGNYSFLFAGDAEEERLSEFININDEKYTLVKIPHHGRISALSEEFVKSVQPSYSIITCSEEDAADKEMIDLLNKYNIKTFMTKDGEIVVKTDGKGISISQKY